MQGEAPGLSVTGVSSLQGEREGGGNRKGKEKAKAKRKGQQMICGLWRLTVTSLTGRALVHSCIRSSILPCLLVLPCPTAAAASVVHGITDSPPCLALDAEKNVTT